MVFAPFIIIIVFGLYFYFSRKSQTEALKRDGIETKGIIIRNNENGGREYYRLGGNFNTPTIQFVTNEGKEIIGEPLVGFTTQYEIVIPSEIDIIYDPQNPENFCVNLD